MGTPHSFMTLLSFFVTALLFLLCAPSANGAITNTTVDDTDPSFQFDGAWTSVSASNPCGGCSSKPDPTQTFGETWHDGNYRTGASETTGGSFTFTGSAVYIFGIDQAQSQPDIAFTLGNTQSVHHYTGTEQFAYHALFFSATGLDADQTYTVNWNFNIDPTTGVGVQAALFDYAIVTSGTDDVAPIPNVVSSSTHTPTVPSSTQAPQSQTPQTSPSNPISSSKPASTSSAGNPSSSTTSARTSASQSKASSATSIPPSATSVLSADTSLSTQGSSSSGSSGSSDSSGASAADPVGAASQHSSNTGAIVGAVLGVLFCLVLALIVFLICRRRRQRQWAREDDERRAAGLPPVPANMRRVRGGPILQPFVDDRPPADSALTGNVFATGSFATASSVTAAAATRTGASGPSAGAGADGTLGPSLNASAGAFEARLGTGAGAGAGAATTGALGRYPSEKTQADYTNLHSQPEVSGQPSQSTQSAISRTNTLMSPLEKHREMEQETALSPSTVRALSTVFSQAPSTVLSPSDAETSARERYLEQRLATLEAHVASYLPPPYEQPESEP